MNENPIKNLQLEYDLAQVDLEYSLTISRRSYSNIENRLSTSKVEQIIKLSLLYDVNPNYLLGLTYQKGVFPMERLYQVIKIYHIDYSYILYLKRKITTKVYQRTRPNLPARSLFFRLP